MSNTPRLALVMIVKNEEKKLARCLISVAGLVDDIILVDTGSTDATVSIAEAHGARVFHFAWCDDFSAARNFALEHSTADWNLVLDADEWLIDSDALVTATQLTPDYLGLICQRNDYLLDGNPVQADCWIPRLLPGGVRYTGLIHEQPDSALPRRYTNIHIGHDGYVDFSHKKGRNRHLLEIELQRNPDNLYYRYQLGKEFEVVEHDYASAAQCYEQVFAKLDLNVSYAHDLITRYLFCLKKTGQFDVAIPLAEQLHEQYHESADFLFVLGDLLLDYIVENPDQVNNLLPMIESAWFRCLEIGENSDYRDSVRGRGSFLAAHNLSVLYEFSGRPTQAEKYRNLSIKLRG